MSLSTAYKVAVARHLGRAVRLLRRGFGCPAVARVRRSGIDWELDLDEGIDLSIYLLGSFEPSVLRTYETLLGPGSIAIDIGANIGAHTLPMARLVGEGGHVYAFEPTVYALGRLRTNLSSNLDLAARVTAIHAYLAGRPGVTVPDAIHSSWPLENAQDLHALHRGRMMPTGNAAGLTLDAFITALEVPRVDFVKIDVDGSEAAVLAGARDTIQRFRPALLVEFAPQERGDCAIAEIVSFLSRMQYRLHQLRRRKELPLDADALCRRIKVGSSMNVLCLPEQ